MTAAEMLSVAAFDDGHFAQAFPSFGSERTGAPVVAFCRIDATRIRTREPIVAPDALIVQDATLVHQVDLFSGLRPGRLPPGQLVTHLRRARSLGPRRVPRGPAGLLTVPATELALEHTGRPVPNAVLLGGFAAQTGAVSLDAVVRAIAARFSGPVAAGNVAAAREAYRIVAGRRGVLADASPG